ncbi:MAG: beta-ketoacyl-[acyl-carrier-protein] synthase family protein [Acidobacteriota bacterium]|nr:beta-ketoacyl-[acyl-carrier-protein] synthase family protein [Acidobacteriota bacterium]
MNAAFQKPIAIVDGAMICPGLLEWEDFREGRSAVRRIDDDFPVRIGAPVPLEDTDRPRGCMLALEALNKLAYDPARRYGLVLGLPSQLSETDYVECALVHRDNPGGMKAALPFCDQEPLSLIAAAIPIAGPRMRLDSACATGNDALIAAAHWLRAGLVDDVLVVCASAMLNPVGTALFRNLKALNDSDDTTSSRPFDLDRRGFVMGEGAAAAWLSNHPPHRPKGLLCGFGQSMNAAGFTDLPEDGAAMEAACRQALGPVEKPAYISAHGTSTQINDAAETRLYRTIFKKHADHIPVSSIKSMIGHTLGAASLIEALVCLDALREQTAPPTINLHRPDPLCDLNYAANKKQPIAGNFALSNAFAFGGHNSCVLLARERP